MEIAKHLPLLLVKDLLKEVKRKSARAEAEADRIAENTKQRYIDYILQQHGLELE